jgi:MFS superfamily sulfate permease-like transporter
VVSALCIALLLICAPMLIKDLPEAALGAVVISACLGLSEISAVRRLYRVRRAEFFLSMICFLVVALLGVSEGIFIAVALALLAFIWRAWHPYDAVLGKIHGVDGFHDVSRFPKAWLLPGLVLFRWDAPLFFANADIFHDHLLQAITDVPTDVKCVVISAEPITDVDTTAADVLSDLDKELARAGIELCFAEMKDPVRDKLKTYGLFTQIGPDMFFPTVRKATDWYKETYQIKDKYPTEPFAPAPPPATPRKRGKTLAKSPLTPSLSKGGRKRVR